MTAEKNFKHIYPLHELIDSFELDYAFVTHCIQSEWIRLTSKQELMFDEEDIARILLIRDLKQDFEVNDEAIPIILHLLDQLHHLRSQLKGKAG